MRAQFTGDFRKLREFHLRVNTVPEAVRTELTKQLAEEAIDLVRDGIAQKRDPYGKRYAPLKLRSGQPLRDTGRMQQWYRKSSGAHGFVIASPASYAIYHQTGTGIHGPKRRPIKPVKAKALRIPAPGGAIFRTSVKGTPRRAMVPYRKTLGEIWARALRETANEFLADHVEGK